MTKIGSYGKMITPEVVARMRKPWPPEFEWWREGMEIGFGLRADFSQINEAIKAAVVAIS